METLNALIDSSAPDKYLRQLYTSGMLKSWLPEVHALYGVPQSPEHHPEIDTGVHIEMCLSVACELKANRSAFLAVLLHDLGKGLTPKNEWPRHLSHESSGVPLVRGVVRRLGLSDYEGAVCEFVCEFHLHAHRLLEMSPKGLLRFFDQVLAQTSHHGSVFAQDFIDACECDKRGRGGREGYEYAQKRFFEEVMTALSELEHLRSPFEEPPSDKWVSWHLSRLNVVSSLKKNFV